MSKRKEMDARRPVIITILFVALAATALTATGCGKQMARMEDNQIKLQAMIMANARQLATVSSQVHVGQNETSQSLAKIEQKADGINTQVRTVQDNQTQLRKTITAGNEQINRKIAKLEANQAHIEDGIAQVGNIAQSTNTAVGAVAKDQATLHRMVQSNKQDLADKIAAVAQDQQRTHAGIDQLQAADRTLAGQITGVAQQQEAMQTLARDNNRQLVGRLTALDSGQTALQNSLASNAQTLADKLVILEQHQNDIQSVIDRVATTTTATAGDVTTLATTQAQMQQTQGSRYENLTGQIAGVARNQQALQTGIDTLDAKANRTTSQLTTLAAGQNTIGETLQASNASVNEGLTKLADNQQMLQAGIGTLDEKADRTTGQLTTLTAGQNTIGETLQANNASVNEGLAKLSNGQQSLRGDVGNLSQQSDALATDLGTALGNQTAMQNTLAAGTQTLTAVSENQTTLQHSVSELSGKADALDSHVSSVAAELGTVHDAVRNGNETLTARIATLAEGQENLNAGIGRLDQQTRQVAVGQADLHKAFQNHDEATRGQMADLTDDQQAIRERVETVMATASQIALNLVTISNQQTQFAQDVQAGFGSMTDNQQALQSNIDTLAVGTTQLGLDVIAVSEGQNDLRQALDTQAGDLAEGNAQLAADLRSVAERQDALNQTLASHDETVAGRMDRLAQTQTELQNGLDGVAATTTQVALDLIALDNGQTTLQQAAQAERARLDTRLTDVVAGQQQLQTGLDTLSATTTQVALDVLTLDEKQARQSESVQANHDAVVARLTETAQAQQDLQSGLDILSATTAQVGLDVLTLDDKQTRQSASVQANHEALLDELVAAANGRQQILGDLDVITATASQIGLDVIALDGKQDSLAQAVQAGQEDFAPKLVTLTDNQQQLQSGLDTLATTTTQVALDVLTLNDDQAKQGQALEATRQTLSSQIETVAQGQQQLQGNLDAVTVTANQLAADVTTLDDNQGRIEQAVEANRQELALKLAEIAQGQQQWLARFDAAEAKVATMTAGISALEERVSKLQGTLQTSLQDLSTLLDTETQQRATFQDSVRQDMRSVTDSVAQLREIQAGLAEHIQRVQDSTLTRTGDILSALEELQKKNNADTTDVGTELKSSKATPQEVLLP